MPQVIAAERDGVRALSPVGRDGTGVHEPELPPLLRDDGEHLQAGTKARQGLAEARLEVGAEVEDANVVGERVEAVRASAQSAPR